MGCAGPGKEEDDCADGEEKQADCDGNGERLLQEESFNKDGEKEGKERARGEADGGDVAAEPEEQEEGGEFDSEFKGKRDDGGGGWMSCEVPRGWDDERADDQGEGCSEGSDEARSRWRGNF